MKGKIKRIPPSDHLKYNWKTFDTRRVLIKLRDILEKVYRDRVKTSIERIYEASIEGRLSSYMTIIGGNKLMPLF